MSLKNYISKYCDSIDDLIYLQDNSYLTFEKIEFWLLKYSLLFTKSKAHYSCSHLAFKLPCMCWNRKADCLFIDVYISMEKLSSMYRKNLYYTEEILRYHTIKQNSEELQKWLDKNLKENNIDLPYTFDSGLYYDKLISFCNGKFQDKYNYFILKVKGHDFKSSYDFISIYNELFFKQKILPKEYTIWEKESGFNELGE